MTVSCSEGETGFVYDGILEFEVTQTDLSEVPSTQNKNYDEPW